MLSTTWNPNLLRNLVSVGVWRLHDARSNQYTTPCCYIFRVISKFRCIDIEHKPRWYNANLNFVSLLRNRLRPYKMIKINQASYIPSKYNHFLPLLLIVHITYRKKVSPFYNFTLFITHWVGKLNNQNADRQHDWQI